MTRRAAEVRLGPWGASAVGIAAALGFVACAKILGDFSAAPTEPAESGAGGSAVRDAGRDSAVRDAGAPDACVEGKMVCQGSTLVTCIGGAYGAPSPCPFVCSGGSCVGICVPNSTSCLGSTLRQCQSDGTWNAGSPCSSSVCIGGPGTDAGPARCLGSCVPGSKRCMGTSTLGTCDQNGISQQSTCPFVCSGADPNAACSGVCVPSSKSCNGKQPLLCGTDGNWAANGNACPSVCSNGSCVSGCIDGATECNGNTVRTCMNGDFVDSPTPCQFGCFNGACTSCAPGSTSCFGNLVHTCEIDGGIGESQCPFLCDDGGCVGVCSPGTLRCANALDSERCTPQAQWVANRHCTFSCVDGLCPGFCDAGAHQCDPDNNNPEVCDTTGQWVSNGSCANGCIGAGVCAGADGG